MQSIRNLANGSQIQDLVEKDAASVKLGELNKEERKRSQPKSDGMKSRIRQHKQVRYFLEAEDRVPLVLPMIYITISHTSLQISQKCCRFGLC